MWIGRDDDFGFIFFFFFEKKTPSHTHRFTKNVQLHWMKDDRIDLSSFIVELEEKYGKSSNWICIVKKLSMNWAYWLSISYAYYHPNECEYRKLCINVSMFALCRHSNIWKLNFHREKEDKNMQNVYL